MTPVAQTEGVNNLTKGAESKSGFLIARLDSAQHSSDLGIVVTPT
ncbi:hypothetical protein [Serratia silvae]|nr:hypothetical protein [Serratia silvae]